MFLDQIASLIALSIFCIVSIFQMLLIMGAPYGKLVWGGKYKKLPIKFRFASLYIIVIQFIAGASLLERSQLINVINMDKLVHIIVWIVTVLFAYSTVANLMTKNKLEIIIMAPVSFVLSIACLIVSLGIK